MGMSASQARFLCLTARKNNVEFEGQQINQQRVTLSNESASYYSELCNMEVPVPPSIDDYTKVSYTFNDGAMTNTITSLLWNDGKYHVNYTRQWQDDYSIVPSSSALVQRGGSAGAYTYNIGGATLRKMDDEAPETVPPGLENDPYYKTLNEDQKLEALETEQYYVALLREHLNLDDAEFYVKYTKNTTTGNFEPTFYLASELEENASYTDRNLASVPCYTVGSATKTKEVLNQTCEAVEQDSSGRYIAITFDSTTGKKDVKYNNAEEIKKWKLEHPEPLQKDFTKEIEVEKEREVDISQDAGELVNTFLTASKSCFDIATGYSTGAGCYKHVLAHLLELECDGSSIKSSAYPKTFETIVGGGKNVELQASNLTSNIQSYGYSDDLVPVSDFVSYGKINGETRDLPVVATVESYQEAISNGELSLSQELLDLLSDKYIKNTGSATDFQKLISNYYVNSDGDVEKKTIKQKAIDLYYILANSYTFPEADYDTVMKPLIYTFQFDMTHMEKTTEKYTDTEIVPDEEEWKKKHDEWKQGIPEYREWTEEEDYTIPGKKYDLVTITTTDEDAYNDAMNDYYYRQHEYDHKVQEINSKLEIIQQQDKQLELKLKQLDTEENAISTEMDAVKKVISKNVDSSFKTFSA